MINVLPAAFLSFPLVRLINLYLIDRHPLHQAVGHFLLALAFSLLWYIGIQVGYGLRDGWVTSGISGRPLAGIALSWQAFQSVSLYAVIAMFAYVISYRRRMIAAEARLSQLQASRDTPALRSSAPFRQVLVKDGRALKPVALADVLMLSGAGDYTEIATRDGTHFCTTPLSAFETELPEEIFTRVHRSHIVRMDAVISIESAGNGRLTLHLPGGNSVTTSRAGARRVRDRAV